MQQSSPRHPLPPRTLGHPTATPSPTIIVIGGGEELMVREAGGSLALKHAAVAAKCLRDPGMR